jgi:hypothetical protein
MWQFDEKEYLARVLGPAVGAFANEGRLPDLFERYALPLDVSSNADVEKALNAVTNFWNKRRQNARDKQLISVLVGQKEQGEARRILLDENARNALRAVVQAERRQRAEQRFKRLDESIAIVAGKGYLTATEVAALEARFIPEAVTREEIRSRIHVPLREVVSCLPSEEGLPQVVRNQIRSNLAVVGKRDLYDFLGAPRGGKPEELKARYLLVEAEWRPRPADYKKTAANDLLGIVKTHLIDGDPARYEKALLWESVEKLRREIELPAADKVITRSEFQALLAFAASIGLSESVATDYILAIAQDPKVGASVQWNVAADSIRCPQCAAFMPRASAAACTICGASLWCDCPRCKTRQPISDQACGRCGFVIGEWPMVKLLTRNAQLYLAEGRLTDALAAARDAEKRWGRQDEVASTLERVEAQQRIVLELLMQIRGAIGERRLVAALKLQARLPIRDPDLWVADRVTLQDLVSSIDAGLKQADEHIKRAQECERAGRAEEAIFAALDALAVCADCAEAEQILRRFPPAAPKDLRATLSDGQIVLHWTPSSAVGEVSYAVVRRETSAPATLDDGTPVGRTKNAGYRDAVTSAGSFLFYGVAALRGGVASAITVSNGVLCYREVEHARLEVGDGVVTGSFDPPARGRVRIFRRQEGMVRGGEPEREIALTSPRAFIDRQVANGQIYHYRFAIDFQLPGEQSFLTSGVTVSAAPDAPPPAVEKLELYAVGEGLELRFSPPAKGLVRIYRCTVAPPWAAGTIVAAEGLARLGPVMLLRSAMLAFDPSPPAGFCFYLAATVAGDHATIGAVCRHASIADVSGFEVQDFGSYAQLRWRWPPDCNQASLAFRADRYPDSPNDPQATCRRITRAEYDRHGGLHLEQPAAAPHYFVLFAIGQLEGELAFASGRSQGARGVLHGQPRVVVSYAFKRQWFRRRLMLELRSDSTIEKLPPLVVLAKPGMLQPISSEDGSAILNLSGLSLSAGTPLEHEIDVSSLRPPYYLRAFFLEPPGSTRCRLADPPHENLKVQ